MIIQFDDMRSEMERYTRLSINIIDIYLGYSSGDEASLDIHKIDRFRFLFSRWLDVIYIYLNIYFQMIIYFIDLSFFLE